MNKQSWGKTNQDTAKNLHKGTAANITELKNKDGEHYE